MSFTVLATSLLSFAVFALWLVSRVLIVDSGVEERSINTIGPYKPRPLEMMLVLFCLMGLVVVYKFQLDFKVADWVYAQTHWVLKKSVIANGILHKLAKVSLMVVYLFLLFKLFLGVKKSGKTQKSYDLAVLLFTIGLSVATVSILKRMLDVDCPWDLVRYGGDKPFLSLFNYNQAFLPSANCFPSSHASVGFSWVAVYFYMSVTNNPLKYKALLAALVLGLLFGITQQLRGAHFMSHDLSSLLICTCTSMVIYSLAYRQGRSTDNA